MIKVGLLGARGRMGQWIIKLLESEFSTQATLIAQANQNDALESLFQADVIIDFSSPSGTQSLLQAALKDNGRLPILVIGTTGWDQSQEGITDLCKKTPILVASNFSIAVFAFRKILEQFSPLLEKFHYTPVIIDTHHIHKKDAPSGTALSLQSSIDSRNPGRISIQSVRAGEVIGDHLVTFYGQGDCISIEHRAQDRSIFARGAIEVALWLTQNYEEAKTLQQVIGIDFYFKKVKEKLVCSN